MAKFTSVISGFITVLSLTHTTEEIYMATDGPTPKPCDSEIFENGRNVCIVSGKSNAIERWVQSVARKANANVDWHYSGGIGNVLHLGDDTSRQRVLKAIEELKAELEGSILSFEAPALTENFDNDAVTTHAVVREINGQLVLDDPDAVEVIKGINKRNCQNTVMVQYLGNTCYDNF
jgi:hypothetical protein